MPKLSRARQVVTYVGAGVVPPFGGVPALVALGLSSKSAVVGQTFSALLVGKAAGSTVSATSSDGSTLVVAGTTISGTFASVGSKTLAITETFAGAAGSPKTTTLTIAVTAVAVAVNPGTLDFSDPANSAHLGAI